MFSSGKLILLHGPFFNFFYEFGVLRHPFKKENNHENHFTHKYEQYQGLESNFSEFEVKIPNKLIIIKLKFVQIEKRWKIFNLRKLTSILAQVFSQNLVIKGQCKSSVKVF